MQSCLHQILHIFFYLYLNLVFAGNRELAEPVCVKISKMSCLSCVSRVDIVVHT